MGALFCYRALPQPGGAFCFGARRVSQLTIRWRDIGELSRFGNMLKVLSTDQFNKVMVRSVNRAGDMAYKGRGPSVIRTLAKQTGLTQKLMRKAIKVRKANFVRLEYELRVEGGDISLRYFKPRETRRGVTAKVKGQRQLFDGAFMRAGRFPNRVDVSAFHGHVFQRAGSGRFPIQKIKSGVFLPKELLTGETASGFNQIVRQALPRRVQHELNRVTGGMFG